jgi:DNA topoisomerase-1
LAKLDAAIAARQAALEKAIAEQKALEAAGPGALLKKQAALEALQAKPRPENDEKKQKEYDKKLKQAEKAVRDAEKTIKQKSKRVKDRVAQAHKALLAAQDARKRAETNYNERLQRAELQLKLVRETKDYALNTSLKNYIDPRVYRDWGERVGYDWKKLYTGSLLKKFAWAMQEDGQAQTKEPDE